METIHYECKLKHIVDNGDFYYTGWKKLHSDRPDSVFGGDYVSYAKGYRFDPHLGQKFVSVLFTLSTYL